VLLGGVGHHLQPLLLQAPGHAQAELAERGVGVGEQPAGEAGVGPGPRDHPGAVGRRAAGGELVDPAVDLAGVEQPALLEQRLDVPHLRGDDRTGVLSAHGAPSSTGVR
jgi:hypothetical protein